MNAKTRPIWARLTASITVTLLIALLGMTIWQNFENREAAMSQARHLASNLHEMTLAGLTGMMMTGTVDRRELFLDQIKQLEGVRDLRVFRSPAVVQQFGPGRMDEGDIEQGMAEVMSSGTPINQVRSDSSGDNLVIVRPALAKSNYLGKNCISCHTVPEGTVLGVVSMKISLDAVNTMIMRQRFNMAASSVLVLLLLSALTYLFIRHFVTRPLASMADGLNQIAKGEGDLSHRLPVAQMDEVGHASQAFNDMMDKLAALVRQIGDTAGEVRKSVGQLVTTATKVSLDSEQQREHSAGATQAVDSVASGVAAIANAAEQVRSQSHSTLDDSQLGSDATRSLVQSMGAVKQSVNGIVVSVQAFVASTKSITDMTQQVKDIADQTNLLALNAAIEAARAGEQGRGFAVVADEVRRLAEKSSGSANDIDSVTRQIARQSSEVMGAIEEGLRHIGRSENDVAAVAAVLERTSGGVARVNSGVDAIGAATHEQKLASARASQNLERIAAMAQTNTLAINDVLIAAHRLELLADGLAAAVGKFDVGTRRAG